MNRINIRCCSRTAEESPDIHRCGYAAIAMPRYYPAMLISKHDIIVKQSGFAREPFSRLSRITVVKALAALEPYNIDKLNFRLIKAFIYFFQFRFKIRYRFDKRYVISNVLSRLSIERNFLNEKSKNVDFENYNISMKNLSTSDNHQTYRELLITMFSIFRQQLLNEYVKKST